jgi:hypothetical protein
MKIAPNPMPNAPIAATATWPIETMTITATPIPNNPATTRRLFDRFFANLVMNWVAKIIPTPISELITPN